MRNWKGWCYLRIVYFNEILDIDDKGINDMGVV
jgi:hypothetical protein